MVFVFGIVFWLDLLLQTQNNQSGVYQIKLVGDGQI